MSSAPAVRTTSHADPAIVRALAGDRDGEAELYRRLLPAVRAYAQRRLPHAAAQDFAHDVLLLVIEAIRSGRVRDPEHVGSFALGVCKNLARDRARAGERRKELLEQFGVTEEDLIELGAPLEVNRAKLEDCFSQLTLRARDVIKASFCDEAPDAEIAQTLGVTPPNVRVIRHRSLAALRSCLERPISWVQR